MTALGATVLAAIRRCFAPLFRQYGFHEVGTHDDLNFASLTAKSRSQYFRISCDFRDRFCTATVGQVKEGVVPPVPIAPARTPSDVREISGAILAWASTGDKATAFAAGSYEEETPDELAAAIQRLAAIFEIHGQPLLTGDQREWEKLAEVTVTRHVGTGL